MTAAKQRVSVEEYLANEARAEFKSEYVAGEVYAMAGGTGRHSAIIQNIAGVLKTALTGKPCHGFVEWLLRIEKDGPFFYPDLLVACGDRTQLLDASFCEEARVVIEVRSDGTERYDRGDKLLAYRKLASLQEYVLVSQNRRLIEVFRRAQLGWIHLTFELNEVAELASIDVKLPLELVYDDTGVTNGA